MPKVSKTIPVIVGVVDGGIGVNWGLLEFEKEEFKTFLHSFLYSMGFTNPRLVNFVRNREDGEIDWFKIRIPSDECQLQGVNPNVAVHQAKRWLTSREPEKNFARKFILGTGSSLSDNGHDAAR